MEHKDQRYYLKKKLFIPSKTTIDFSFQGRHKGLDICFNIIQMKKTWERGRKIIILMLVNLFGLQCNERDLRATPRCVRLIYMYHSVYTLSESTATFGYPSIFFLVSLAFLSSQKWKYLTKFQTISFHFNFNWIDVHVPCNPYRNKQRILCWKMIWSQEA